MIFGVKWVKFWFFRVVFSSFIQKEVFGKCDIGVFGLNAKYYFSFDKY